MKSNTFNVIVFAALICSLLWVTRPSEAIKACEKVNKAEFCQILNAE